jgi:hypothetical protein
VGTDLVPSEGEPLPSDIRSCARFCDERGRFVYGAARVARPGYGRPSGGPCSPSCAARVERCRDAGIRVTHVDSHRHVHHQPAIAPLVLHVAHELSVPAVRVLENRAIGASIPHRSASPGRTRACGTPGWPGRGTSARWTIIATSPRAAHLLGSATHPVLDARGRSFDALHPGRLLREHVGRAPGYRAAVSYAGARERRAGSGRSRRRHPHASCRSVMAWPTGRRRARAARSTRRSSAVMAPNATAASRYAMAPAARASSTGT